MPHGSTHDLGLALGEQGKDSGSRVTSDDGNGVLGRIGSVADHGRNESGRSHNVEVRDTEQSGLSRVLSSDEGDDSPLGVVDSSLLQSLGEDWNGRVDGV